MEENKNLKIAEGPQQSQTPLDPRDEKIVIEAMQTWYRNGEHRHVLDVAKRLLARNPQSEGAKLLLAKSIGKARLEEVMNSLTRLFGLE